MQKKQYTKRTQKLKSKKNGVMISIYNPLEARFMEQLEQNSAVISYQKNVSLSGWETWIGGETFSVSPAAVTTDFLVQYSDGHQEATEIVERKTLGKPATLQLLELSRRYWLGRRIDWGIWTDKEG